jgi:hypothetical protein
MGNPILQFLAGGKTAQKGTWACFLLSGTGPLAYPLRRAAFRLVGTCSSGFAFMSRMFFFVWMNKLVKVAGLTVSGFLLIYQLQIGVVEFFEEIFPRYLQKL